MLLSRSCVALSKNEKFECYFTPTVPVHVSSMSSLVVRLSFFLSLSFLLLGYVTYVMLLRAMDKRSREYYRCVFVTVDRLSVILG